MSALAEAVADALGPGRHLGIQLYVSLDGVVIHDFATGQRDDGSPIEVDDLQVWFSGSKPLLAVALCQLRDRQLIDLDQPVRQLVARYTGPGTETITCRHLLAHAGGRLVADDPAGVTSAFSVEYPEALDIALNAALHHDDRPGQQSSYASSILSWLILSEVVRCVDGRRFDRYIADEVLAPLEIEGYYGFSAAELATLGERVTRYETPRQANYLNDADAREGAAIHRVLGSGRFHESLDPGAGFWSSAKSMGRFYDLLCSRTTGDDGPVIAAASVTELVSPQRPSFFEEAPLIDFGLGVTLESRQHGQEYAYFGSHPSFTTFGHQGHGSPMAFADPEHRLVLSFNGNGLPGRVVGKRIWRRISDAVYEDLGLRSSGAAVVGPARPGRLRTIDLRPAAVGSTRKATT